MQIVELGAQIVDVAAVEEGVDSGQVFVGVAVVDDGGFAVGGVAVAQDQVALAVCQADDIALDVGDVIVGAVQGAAAAGVGEGEGCAGSVVGKVNILDDLICLAFVVHHPHLGQLVAVIDVITGCGSLRARGTHTVCVIGVGERAIILFQLLQLSALLPGVILNGGTGGCIHDLVRIADAVIGNGVSRSAGFVAGQQIAPVGVIVPIIRGGGDSSQTVGRIGITLGLVNVTGVVISPGLGISLYLVILPDQLIGGVIDIGSGFGAVWEILEISGINCGMNRIYPAFLTF